MERQKMFNITQQERSKLLDYMSKRPYAEVYVLIAMLVSLKPIKEEKNSKEDKPKKVVM